MAHTKIVPPVTPRIVQSNPSGRLVWSVLLVFVVFLTAWFSYDYGRSRVPVTLSGDAALAAQSAESAKHITALEQERDALKQRVAKLEQQLDQGKQSLESAQSRIRTLQQASSSRQVVTAPPASPAPVAEETPVSNPADNTLTLENITLVETESENRFRINFSVLHGDNDSGRVTGTIWIAVNGLAGGEPRRLSFKTLSKDRRSYVKMGFDQQQYIDEELLLPEGFRPRNILIEAKPYGEKYTGTSEKIAWDTDG